MASMEWIQLVQRLLTVAVRVAEYAHNAWRYQDECQLLEIRVQLISTHLRALEKAQWTPDQPAMEETLECLRKVLGRAEDLLVMSCQHKTKSFFDFFNVFKDKAEFKFVNKQMDHIMESFHLANHTLILLGSSDRIFMAVLDTLVPDGACKRLPQDKKDVLLKSMSGLNSDNMSPEKKKTLELIRRDLTEGSNWPQWQLLKACFACLGLLCFTEISSASGTSE